MAWNEVLIVSGVKGCIAVARVEIFMTPGILGMAGNFGIVGERVSHRGKGKNEGGKRRGRLQ